MSKEINITSEELYYLSAVMQAKYIDYVYVSNIVLMEESIKKLKEDAQRTLSEKKYIDEDFSGNVMVAYDVERVLKPVFFGEKESSVTDINQKNDMASFTNYHFLDGDITAVTEIDEKLVFNLISTEEIENKIEKLIPSNYEDNVMGEIEIAAENISRIISIKTFQVGVSSGVFVYIANEDGVFCTENGEEAFVSVGREEMITHFKKVILEGRIR